MDKRPFFILPLIFLLIGGGARFLSGWQQNQAAVFAIAHLSQTTSCAIDEASLQWEGDMLTMVMDPYLQMVAASALNTEIAPPVFEMWQRDPRLYYWFMAQTAVKNNNYESSLEMLRQAAVGSMLDAAGHTTSRAGHLECGIINWTLASELGYREPPDGDVQHLMNHQLYGDVTKAFNRLLRYDSKRVAWRLSLAKAYAAMGETTAVEETLAPVLLNGTVEEIEAANKLLQSIP